MNRRPCLSLLFAVMLLGTRVLRAAPFELEVQLQKPGDVAVIKQEADRTIIDVTSRMGIGQMTLSSKDGHWPKDVTLRLRYQAAHPFKTLEGFEMTTSRIQVRSSTGQPDKSPFFLVGDDGNFSRDDLNPSGWLRIKFQPHGDDLDVIFPANLWREEKKVQIQWIDFYRT